MSGRGKGAKGLAKGGAYELSFDSRFSTISPTVELVPFKADEDFLCPLSGRLMIDPVSISEGNDVYDTYDRASVEAKLQQEPYKHPDPKFLHIHPKKPFIMAPEGMARKRLLKYLTNGGDSAIKSELATAACTGNFDRFQSFIKFLESHLNKNHFVDEKGNTILHLALANKQFDFVHKLLIESNAAKLIEINATNNDDMTILHYAICMESAEMCRFILDRSKQSLKTCSREGWQPVHYAALLSSSNVLKVLLDADRTIVDDTRHDKATALHIACANIKDASVQLLLEYGADVSAVTRRGNTPLHIFCSKVESDHSQKLGCQKILQLLLNSKADFEATNSDEDTPLHLAVIKSNITAVQFLLEQLPDLFIDPLDSEGRTPLLYAMDHVEDEDDDEDEDEDENKQKADKYELVCLLVGHGANPEIHDENGKNVFHRAGKKLKQRLQRLINKQRRVVARIAKLNWSQLESLLANLPPVNSVASPMTTLSKPSPSPISSLTSTHPIPNETRTTNFKFKMEKPEKKKDTKKERDPNAPKRATTAYFLYCVKARADARKLHPEMKVTEIAKILAEQWRNLSADEKKPFLDQAKAAYEATKKSSGGDKASKHDEDDDEEEEDPEDDE